jgi:hypothetical protein
MLAVVSTPAADALILHTHVLLRKIVEDVSGGFHDASGLAEPPSIRADINVSNTRALVRRGRLKSLEAGGPI